jgi:hypothetical protein
VVCDVLCARISRRHPIIRSDSRRRQVASFYCVCMALLGVEFGSSQACNFAGGRSVHNRSSMNDLIPLNVAYTATLYAVARPCYVPYRT